MRQMYATRLRCDACGAEAEVKLNTAMEIPPDPDGWTRAMISAGRSVLMARDLCPDCSCEPFATILDKLTRDHDGPV
jgi:hypothetical protein